MDSAVRDTEAAARYLGLSRFTLERMRVTGTGPKFCKLSSRVLYRNIDLDDYLAARVVQSTSERVAA